MLTDELDRVAEEMRRYIQATFAGQPELRMPARFSGNVKFNLDLGPLLAIEASILSIVGSIATLIGLW